MRTVPLKVAVSLRRDEPCRATLPAIWPVDFEDAYAQSGLHCELHANAQRLISAERDGYIGVLSIAKYSSAQRTYQTNTLRTLSP